MNHNGVYMCSRAFRVAPSPPGSSHSLLCLLFLGLSLCWTSWNSPRFSATRAHEPWIHGKLSAPEKARYRRTGPVSGWRFGAGRPAASAVPEPRNFHRLSGFTPRPRKPTACPRARTSSGKSDVFILSHELTFKLVTTTTTTKKGHRKQKLRAVTSLFFVYKFFF